jgi:hypothetical protein
MSLTPPSLDQLQQIHELNRLFLSYLQTTTRTDPGGLGLPERARASLGAASAESLAWIAEFPRAMFEIALDDAVRGEVVDPLRSREDAMRHALSLTILLCARSVSRQSPYQARLLLGLESREIQRLRSMQLADLQRLAHSPRLLRCAFGGRDWLWSELLTERRPEGRRHLALVALQPGVGREWPARRVPHRAP